MRTKKHLFGSRQIGFYLVFLGIFLGIFVGIRFPEDMLSLTWIGKLFLNLLKMLVLPLIMSALITAIATAGDVRKLGVMGFYTFGYIIFSAIMAVTIGGTLVNIFKPGENVSPHFVFLENSEVAKKSFDFSEFFVSFFPSNIVEAAVKFEIMPIVFFSIFFGIGCIACGKEADHVVSFFRGLRTIMIKLISWVMHLTPLALFSLLGTAFAEATLQNRLAEDIKGLLMLILVLLLGFAIQILWQMVAIKLIARVKLTVYILKATGTLMTAFATSSSMATLPVAMVTAKEQGVRDDVARFVLPFATTINLSATVMYEAVAAIFFSQVMGIELSIYDQGLVFFLAIIAGMGATGIPEGGLITMITVLRAVNLPASCIALLLPFDRILDRCRTATNVWGDLSCAIVVDNLIKRKQEKENSGPAKFSSSS